MDGFSPLKDSFNTRVIGAWRDAYHVRTDGNGNTQKTYLFREDYLFDSHIIVILPEGKNPLSHPVQTLDHEAQDYFRKVKAHFRPDSNAPRLTTS